MTQQEIENKYLRAKQAINARHQEQMQLALEARDRELQAEILPREAALANIQETQLTAKYSLKDEATAIYNLCRKRDNNELSDVELEKLETRLSIHHYEKKRFELSNLTFKKAKSEVSAMRADVKRKLNKALMEIHNERDIELQKAREIFYSELTELKTREA